MACCAASAGENRHTAQALVRNCRALMESAPAHVRLTGRSRFPLLHLKHSFNYTAAMDNLTLKAGQVAAVLNISIKRLQNTVDAGYLRPALAGSGRGSVRQYSFEDVVRMQALEILVNAYGVAASRAAQMLSEVWPRRFKQQHVLVIAPKATVRGVKLEPIKLPLKEITAAAEARIQQVLAGYQKQKRGRPVGWSAKFNQALAQVSDALQEVSDEQIAQEVAAHRRERRTGKK